MTLFGFLKTINQTYKMIFEYKCLVVDGHNLYKNLDGIICRTKLIAEVDAEKVQKYFSPDEYGIHRNATLGDLRKKIKDLAVLIGFDMMEEDR